MPKKVDANQAEIVGALRKAGASVVSLHFVGKGVPDLLVGFRGENYLFEIKTPVGKLSERQKAWRDAWRGTMWVVRSSQYALEIIGAIE